MPKTVLEDRVLYPCQVPSLSGVTTVIFKNGSGGFQCRSDLVPMSPRNLVDGDEALITQLRYAFDNAYRSQFGREWTGV